MTPTAVIPLKAFTLAKQRLAPALDRRRRAMLARATADRVTQACIEGGFEIAIVTADAAVADWAAVHAAVVIPDPSDGLDAACHAGVAEIDGPWIIVHGDLPLLDAAAMGRARATLCAGGAVIAPSRDGGTNLLGGSDEVRFSYGPGSFHRHLGRLSRPLHVLTGIETIIELDTPTDLSAAARLPGGAWLARFLVTEDPPHGEEPSV